jgi:integrase
LGLRAITIRYAHKLAGHVLPTDDERVKATMRGIRRSLGTAPRKKAPATSDRIVAMAFAAGDDLKGLRDRALLLVGFAGAFRRSELVALNVEDLEETNLGFKATIRHSKTDQEGAGQTIAIVKGSVACPVAALRAWIAASGIASGADLVRRRVAVNATDGRYSRRTCSQGFDHDDSDRLRHRRGSGRSRSGGKHQPAPGEGHRLHLHDVPAERGRASIRQSVQNGHVR